MAEKFVIDTITIILSCCFSFLSITISKLVPYTGQNEWAVIIMAICCSLICAILCSLLLKSQKVEKFFTKYFHISLFDSVISSALNTDEGAYVIIYLKNKNFYLQGYFSGQDGNYIRLSNPEKIDLNDNSVIYSHDDTDDIFVICDLNEIEYLEISR